MNRFLTLVLASALALAAGCSAPAPASSGTQPSSSSQGITVQEPPSQPPSSSQGQEEEKDLAGYMGGPMGDVVAVYGEDYQLSQVNSQFLTYELENGVTLTFHCSAPKTWGTYDAADPVTYISVLGPPEARVGVMEKISLGMTLEEVRGVLPDLADPPEEGPGGDSYDWSGEIGGSFCRAFFTFGKDGGLVSADIKGEELMERLSAPSSQG